MRVQGSGAPLDRLNLVSNKASSGHASTVTHHRSLATLPDVTGHQSLATGHCFLYYSSPITGNWQLVTGHCIPGALHA